MDEGKLELQLQKRVNASKQVIINFPTDDNTFQVLDEEGNVKYTGLVQGKDPHKDDDCTCPNFKPLNNEKWMSTHGYSYNCKHIIAARAKKFGVIP